MTVITPLNVGTAPNNGTGQSLRSGGQTINANFSALNAGKQEASPKLSTLAASVWAANMLQYQTGSEGVANTPFTVAARALLDDPDEAAMRVTLGLGGQILQALQALTMTANGVPYMASANTMAVQASTAFGRGLLNLASAAAIRSAAELTIPIAVNTNSTTDFNTLITSGWQSQIYNTNNPNSPDGIKGNTSWWYIHNTLYGAGGATLLQYAYPYGTGNNARGRVAWRSLYQTTWTDWSYGARSDDLGAVASENVVPVAKGGTGASTPADARIALDVFSKSESGRISQKLPPISGNNALFNHEGNSVAGWSVVANGTLSSSNSWMRLTKNTGAATPCSARHQVSIPPEGGDLILYGRYRQRRATDTVGVIWLLKGNTDVSIWFGTGTANSAAKLGAISISGSTGPLSTNIDVAEAAGNYNFDTTPVEFALQLDTKYQTLILFIKENGLWVYKARVNNTWYPDTNEINMIFGSASVANSWAEIDYLTLCRPNLVVWGDSIAEGKTLYSPNPALNLTNWLSHWGSAANLYPNMRNNLPVVKGVGGRSSSEMLANIGEIDRLGAKVVFYHASSNDVSKSVSQSVRTSATQAQVDRLASQGARVVVLNAMQGTPAYTGGAASNTLKPYVDTWWSVGRLSIKGVDLFIDIAEALGLNGYLNPAYSQSDNIHPNLAGQSLIGQTVSGYLAEFSEVLENRERLPVGSVYVDALGLSAGAIVEEGSNANGDYIKFASGWMICTFSITVTDQAIADAYGTLFTGSRAWTFPVPFVSPPVVTPGQFRWGTSASWATVLSTPSETGCGLGGVDIMSRAAGSSTVISATAMGRWKNGN